MAAIMSTSAFAVSLSMSFVWGRAAGPPIFYLFKSVTAAKLPYRDWGSSGLRRRLGLGEPAGDARPGGAQGLGADEQAEMVAGAGRASDAARPGAAEIAHRHRLRQRHHLVVAGAEQEQRMADRAEIDLAAEGDE